VVERLLDHLEHTAERLDAHGAAPGGTEMFGAMERRPVAPGERGESPATAPAPAKGDRG
jgi:hypothetical protein